jgi:hypothetical protein
LFYTPYGYKFSTQEMMDTTQLTNRFGDEPLPAFKTYKITDLNSKENYFRLAIKQDIDRAGAEKFFEGF